MTDRMLWRRDLRAALGGVSDETLRKWIKAEKVPKPDVDISNRTRGWRLSTLHKAGIKLLPVEASPPTPASSDA